MLALTRQQAYGTSRGSYDGQDRPAMTGKPNESSSPSRSIAIGIACGVGAAVFWAAGFVAARHGIDIGFTPADLTFHRCFWAGVVLLAAGAP